MREKHRVIYNIDYNAIEKLWEKVLADEEANKPEEPAAPDTPEATQDEGGEGGGEGEPTPEEELELRFLEFCRQQTVSQLNLCAKYGYDGVQVNYTGRAPQAMQEEEKAQYAARQEAFFSNVKTWNEANSGKVLVFQAIRRTSSTSPSWANAIYRHPRADRNFGRQDVVRRADGRRGRCPDRPVRHRCDDPVAHRPER